jgi:hypothetical protein
MKHAIYSTHNLWPPMLPSLEVPPASEHIEEDRKNRNSIGLFHQDAFQFSKLLNYFPVHLLEFSRWDLFIYVFIYS